MSLPARFLLSCVAVATFALLHGGRAVASEVAPDDKADAPASQRPALQMNPCPWNDLFGGSALARCGWLQVAENRDAPAGKTLRLRVTVIPALRSTPEPDALVILAGGPGQSAHDVYSASAAAFAAIRRERDIVLLDQRGTGRSNRLDCDFAQEETLEAVDPPRLQQLARACLAALPGDPRFYTTSVAVRDLEDLRAALGYRQLTLYSGSYGTRVAQHYLRRYPTRVRAAILDGVVPVGLPLGPDIAARAQQALDAIFERCAKEAACASAFPELHHQFDALRARLERGAIQVQLSDPVTDQPMSTTFGTAELSAAVRLLTYSDETASVLPLLIHQAQTLQHPQSLAAQYLMIERTTTAQLAQAMHFAVVCSEDAPLWGPEAAAGDADDATYLGANFMTALRAICAVWPRGPVDEDFNAPLHSDVPVLILSGGNDPVTPPDYGVRALPSFKHGRHLVLDGQGHGQLLNGCMPNVVTQFVRTARAGELDVKCLQNVVPAPFLLSPNGSGS